MGENPGRLRVEYGCLLVLLTGLGSHRQVKDGPTLIIRIAMETAQQAVVKEAMVTQQPIA
ncbi:MAG: hypothetical protein R2932_38090 [Caldilineaceae bacterium]